MPDIAHSIPYLQPSWFFSFWCFWKPHYWQIVYLYPISESLLTHKCNSLNICSNYWCIYFCHFILGFLFPMVSIYLFPLLIYTGLKVKTSYFWRAVVTLNLLNTASPQSWDALGLYYCCLEFLPNLLMPLLKLVILLFYTVNAYSNSLPFLCLLLFLKSHYFCVQFSYFWTIAFRTALVKLN